MKAAPTPKRRDAIAAAAEARAGADGTVFVLAEHVRKPSKAELRVAARKAKNRRQWMRREGVTPQPAKPIAPEVVWHDSRALRRGGAGLRPKVDGSVG